MARLPVLFVTHGAGPMMFLESSTRQGPNNFDKNSPAAKWFRQLYSQLSLDRPPKAILLISAHWETTEAVHISAQSQHSKLFYDYYNFPPEAYEIEFTPAGHPELAERVKSLLEHDSIPCKLDAERNLDHGVFIPLKLTFPKADIPVVSMSILSSLSPAQHLLIGKALAPLRNENVLIIGSGSTIHGSKGGPGQSDQFVDALTRALTECDAHERDNILLNWEQMLPYARANHPREEHLIPLHVVVGAAGTDRGQICNPSVPKLQAAYQFGS
ncbi:unnamed protein product [Rotaria magnacalcarata]|uniref:Extradiol ring-cleavage dioxygenase class III enzyme subunit B domain-containing protein n=3 Tax=Rotaria magnacalcarata TaxID=392030 RepID=A0A816KFA7_9BILA|nr:unnamed protein product [Rotaria magnacalcarata]